jgi:hypothetical protein
MRSAKILAATVVVLWLCVFLVGCAKFITKEAAFPKMYEEKPLSILVLPPMNETTAADAKEYYAVTIAEPLTMYGFYVFPFEVVADILKNEGMYDTELITDAPLDKFRQFFGADGVMFIKIKEWNTAYYVIGGHVAVGVEFILKSTKTGDTLWAYDGRIVVDTSGGGYGGGWVGLVAKVVETAIKTALTDYVPIAKRVNYMTLGSMPYGKYHSFHGKDGKTEILDKNVNKPKEKTGEDAEQKKE